MRNRGITRSVNNRAAGALLFLIVLCCSTPAFGQGNYQPYVLGLRTAGMGGAATAFGQDSAMSWVNPAGIARAGRDTLSLSASAYMIQQMSVNEFWSLSQDFQLQEGVTAEAGRGEVRSNKVSVFPSSVAYIFQLDDAANHMLAVSAMVPYRASFDKRSNINLQLGTVRWINEYQEIKTLTYYEIGPTYAARFGKFTVGLSAFFRYVPMELDQYTENMLFSTMLGEAVFSPQIGHARGNAYEMDFVAGAQAGPFWGGFYAGLTVHSPSVHLGGSLRFENFGYFAGRDVDTGEGDFSVSFSTLGKNSIEIRTPLWFSLGLGYEKPGSFAISADVSYHIPYSYTSQSGTQEYTVISSKPVEGSENQHVETRVEKFDTQDKHQGVINANLGVEVYLSPRLVLRAGGFTDFSSTDIPSKSERTKYDTGFYEVDRYGATLGIAYAGDSSRFQLAFMYLGGLGNIVGWQLTSRQSGDDSGLAFPTRELASNTYMLVFSGEIDTGVILEKAKNAALEEYYRATEAAEEEASEPPPAEKTPADTQPAADEAPAVTPPAGEETKETPSGGMAPAVTPPAGEETKETPSGGETPAWPRPSQEPASEDTGGAG